MRKTILSLALMMLMVGCIKSSTPVETHVDTFPNGVTKETNTKKFVELHQYNKLLCVKNKLNGKDWPVDKAIQQWNKNERNLFSTRKNCKGTSVVLVERYMSAYAGTAEFTGSSILITLSPDIREEYGLATLCHELGHALGLPHNSNSNSCMNLYEYEESPSVDDLERVAEKRWVYGNAAIDSIGEE